jgi:hypothetical protein
MPWDPFAGAPIDRRFIWAAMAFAVVTLQGPNLVGSLRPPPTKGVDFFQDWASARNVWMGLPVYEPLGRAVDRHLALDPDVRRQIRVVEPINAHPPSSVLLALPFAWLDYPNAVLAWNLTSLAMIAVSLWLLSRGLGLVWTFWDIFPASTLLILCEQVRDQIRLGQFNGLLLLLLTAGWLCDRAGRLRIAGVLVALATVVKLYPGFFFLYFLLRRAWQAVIAGFIALLVLTTATLCVVGVDAFVTYVRDVVPLISASPGRLYNVSLAGMFGKWFDPKFVESQPLRVSPLWSNPMAARLAGACASVLVLAVTARWIANAANRRQRDLAFGLSLIAMLLVSPVSWDHYLLVLLIPVGMAWIGLPVSPGIRLGFLLTTITLFSPIFELYLGEPSAIGTASSVETVTVLSLRTYAMIALMALCGREWKSMAGIGRLDLSGGRPS